MSKVKYKLTQQGYGSLINADKVLVNRELVFEVDAKQSSSFQKPADHLSIKES